MIDTQNGSTATADLLGSRSNDIAAFLRLLHPDGVFEIRSPDCPVKPGSDYKRTASGYFMDHQIAVQAVRELDRAKPMGIYVTANVIDPGLFARCGHALDRQAKHPTADADVIHLKWVLIDIDVKRPAGTSSTDAEHQAAIELAERIRDELAADGWPDCLLMSSGNGSYLLFNVDLPNTPDNADLVKRFLLGLKQRYDTDLLQIDEKTFNPSRIMKIAGTTARKGSDVRNQPGMEDRPHRQSWFEVPAGPLNPVPADLLEVAAVPKAASAEPTNGQATKSTSSPANAADRCRKYIAHLDDAISGNSGHDRMLEVACTTMRFGLSDSDAMRIIHEFNDTRTGEENKKDCKHHVRW